MSEKIEQFWRDADGADVMRVMDGQAVEARFRDFDSEEWGAKFLFGYLGCGPLGCNWIDMGGIGWKQCQVYDPPAWFLNKPDPCEGYRLLEKFPPEELQPGDEWFEPVPFETGWKTSHNEKQANTIWYRRRIANNPEIPDSCRANDFVLVEGFTYTIPSGKVIRITAKGFEVV